MAGVIPNAVEAEVLEQFVGEGLVYRLYSNDVTPDENSSGPEFNQVSGGGYEPAVVPEEDWEVTEGDPTIIQAPEISFTFTGTTDAPGTIYGFYAVDLLGNFKFAERFAEAVLPLTPVSGSVIRIVPTVQAS